MNLKDVREQLADARRLAYNAAQIGDASGYGRLERLIEELERKEDALR